MTAETNPSAAGLAWAQRLVRFNTVSRESNLPLIECIADHLRSLGVPLRLSWDDNRRKANLFATLGEGKPGGVILSGHTDTVPWDGQAWTVDPLGADLRTVDGEPRLYGRGSADMKGSVAAFVVALEAFVAAHPRHAGKVALLLTSDEEGDAIDGVAGIAVRAVAAVGEHTEAPLVAHAAAGGETKRR